MDNRRRYLIIGLFVLTLIVGSVAVYIGVQLQRQPDITPPKTDAYVDWGTNYGPCSGNCDSGPECSGYGDPPAGMMFSCWEHQGSYGCYAETTNEGGNSCYLSCSAGWQPCGCNVAQCEQRCRDQHAGQTGTWNYTDICDGCQQKFTCTCTLQAYTPTPSPTQPPVTSTPTPTTPQSGTPTPTPTTPQSGTPTPTTPFTATPSPTPTITYTPTGTPSLTPSHSSTPTPTPTATLPPAALISDSSDRILIGVLLIAGGLWVYLSGAYQVIGNKVGGPLVWLVSPGYRGDRKKKKFEERMQDDSN